MQPILADRRTRVTTYPGSFVREWKPSTKTDMYPSFQEFSSNFLSVPSLWPGSIDG
jgi:hypothetical protein